MNCATFSMVLLTCVLGQLEVPEPVITLHSGHIGLYDRLLETQFNGDIETGEPYTLDIYMGNTEEYDYAIENCVFNSRLSFMDSYGCLVKSAFFVDKYETDQYDRRGAIKRTLVHFFADQPILNFECQVKVIRCSGCAEQSCERRPIYSSYTTWNMPLSCCNNYPPYMPPPIPPPIVPAPFPHQDWLYGEWLWGLPWYWWVLIFLLLLLLLCCILCLLAWCCMRGRRKRRDSQYSGESFTPSNDRIYTVDDAVQTLPELKQAAQQVNMHESYSRTNYIHPPQQEYAYSLRQFDNHGAIDLHPESGTTRRAASAAYTNHVYDGDFYEEDLHERAFTKYEGNKRPKYGRSTPITHSISIRQPSSYGSQEERRLQRELEEHFRQTSRDRSDEFVERIEEQLRSHHYQRHVEPESLREETVRSMRQSSII